MSARLRKILLFGAVAALLPTAAVSPAAPFGQARHQPDPVVFTFCTVGDSRTGADEPGLSLHDQIWLQNTRALSRLIREIQAQSPQAMFFNGDMIMGYSTNHGVLNRQYAYWRGMMSTLLETGTYLVPVPGNHEVQIKAGTNVDLEVIKLAQPQCEQAWRNNMGDLILDCDLWTRLVGHPPTAWTVQYAPPVGGPDMIESDQRQLSFSFDCQRLHFAVINTDPYRHDSHAPTHWLREDLGRARARGCRRFFIFGHKMAFTYYYKPEMRPKGLDAFMEEAQAFWKVIEDYDATYFCGHEHIYHSMRPVGQPPRGSWQVIVGSGGSPFEAQPGESANPNDRMYAWASVAVHASGRVHMDAYGFDDHFGATRRLESIEIQGAAKKPVNGSAGE